MGAAVPEPAVLGGGETSAAAQNPLNPFAMHAMYQQEALKQLEAGLRPSLEAALAVGMQPVVEAVAVAAVAARRKGRCVVSSKWWW